MKVLLALLMLPWVYLIPAANAFDDPCADWNRAVGYVDGDCYYTTRSTPPTPVATLYQPGKVYEVKRAIKKGVRIVRIHSTKAGTLKLKPGDVLTGSSFPPK